MTYEDLMAGLKNAAGHRERLALLFEYELGHMSVPELEAERAKVEKDAERAEALDGGGDMAFAVSMGLAEIVRRIAEAREA